MTEMGSTEHERASARLVVISKAMPPEQLTTAIGLEPDRYWRKGEVVGQRRPRVNQLNGVEYFSLLPSDADPHDHLDRLLERLRPHAQQLRQVANAIREEENLDAPVRLWFSHQTSDYTPGYDFSHDQLQQIASLGAFLAVSLFVNEGIADDSGAS